MRSEITIQPQPVSYIACDLAEGETLAEYGKRRALPRRRWWLAGAR